MNHKKRKNYPLLIAAALIVLIVLLGVLYICEHNEPNSNIKTIGDVIWYAIVTITTVGYGDMTPVSAVGRVIGGIFLICSMGILVALLGTVISFITGAQLPRMRLRFNKGKNWYYFSSFSEESDILAKDITENDPDSVIIYGVSREKDMDISGYPCIFLQDTPGGIVKLKGGHGSRCRIFFMQEDDFKHGALAVRVSELNADVYVRTSRGPANGHENIHYFHTYDCCARGYWKSHPLTESEKDIVIIGFENYGKTILERAILTNVISADSNVTYHIFGDASEFLMIHEKLGDIFSINKVSDKGDSIIFHKEKWEECRQLIADASRIILCSDNDEQVWEDYWRMNQFYQVSGKIDIRSSRQRGGFSLFGTYEDIFSVQQVIRTRLDYAAYAMNELYIQDHGEDAVKWEDLSDSLQQSKIAMADHLYAKVRIILGNPELTEIDSESMKKAAELYQEQIKDTAVLETYRKIEHRRWRRFYNYINWGYAENWDNDRRLNPMMVEYEQLSEKDRKSRDKAWELIGVVAPRLGQYENPGR